jgi:hypothetical protein
MAIIPDDEPPQGQLGAMIDPQLGVNTPGGMNSIMAVALLSAGLRGLSPGWGSGSHQLAGILGAATQGAQGNAAALQKQELNQRDFDYKADEAEANRAQQLEIAEKNRMSREELGRLKHETALQIEGSRAEGRMARIAAMSGARNDHEHSIYGKAYVKALENFQRMGRAPEIAESEARDAATRAMLDFRAQRGSGAPGSSQGAPGATAPGSGAPGQEGAKSPARTTQTSEPAKSPDAAPFAFDPFGGKLILGRENVQFHNMQNDPKHGSKFKEDLQTPEGRQRIIDRNPALKVPIEEWIKNQEKFKPYKPSSGE